MLSGDSSSFCWHHCVSHHHHRGFLPTNKYIYRDQCICLHDGRAHGLLWAAREEDLGRARHQADDPLRVARRHLLPCAAWWRRAAVQQRQRESEAYWDEDLHGGYRPAARLRGHLWHHDGLVLPTDAAGVTRRQHGPAALSDMDHVGSPCPNHGEFDLYPRSSDGGDSPFSLLALLTDHFFFCPGSHHLSLVRVWTGYKRQQQAYHGRDVSAGARCNAHGNRARADEPDASRSGAARRGRRVPPRDAQRKKGEEEAGQGREEAAQGGEKGR